ncbi:MAG: phthiocerol/phenolphthiocerol synthesis type-I polyketide synthase, partial [Solirubrobacteraceae bacterium]|nr:phthiocerol/phenolphthiocerol synthesis type-I polyketide synthase [Solirubrobacteraceae bacterium]
MATETDIAVIGIGCRFPDARDPRELWRNVDAGVVSIRELTDDQLRRAGTPEELLRAPDFVRVAATLPGVEDFASEFFGYGPTEAELIDPQQRIFLEASWEALESAGHPPSQDGAVVGVFAGGATSTYAAALFAAKASSHGLAAAVDDVDLHLGGLGDFLTSRVAYKLGLRGPTVGVQTACSSSLYAVHYATLSLLSGECDIALAGGATVLEPIHGYRYSPGGLMSVDGMCRAFDAGSTGTSFSSGIGVVALRRLADALADGDTVLAVVRGSAVGNDGANRSGFTAPNPGGVADVVASALSVAGVPADALRYVEAHGSGTALGDHIELRGLAQGLRSTTGRSGFCGLGSVKTNIGHCGPAAGIAGFIKAVHVARTGSLPPHPLFERPRDPGVLAGSPFVVSATAGHCDDRDRHVLVNSMGLGGTNCAAVLGPPPAPVRPPAPARDVVRLVVSARSRGELDELSRRLADELERGEWAPADVAHTLRCGRRSFDERRVVSAPADRLVGALRLPRAPLATTRRAAAQEALLVLPAGGGLPAGLRARLDALFAGRAEVTTAPLTAVPEHRFPIVVDGDAPASGGHALALAPNAAGDELVDALEAAATAAWLHGVEVDWDALGELRGRRVALPTYPFKRRRHWALDRLGPIGPPPAAGCAAAAPAAAAPAAAALAAGGAQPAAPAPGAPAGEL